MGCIILMLVYIFVVYVGLVVIELLGNIVFEGLVVESCWFLWWNIFVSIMSVVDLMIIIYYNSVVFVEKLWVVGLF